MIICRIAAVQPQTAGVLPGVAEESKSYTVKMLSEADVFLTIINYNWLCPQTQFQPLYQKHYGPITQLCKRKKKKCGEGQSESNRCSFTSSLNWFVDFFFFGADSPWVIFWHFVPWKGHLVAFPCFDGTVKPGLGWLANLAAAVIIVDKLAK